MYWIETIALLYQVTLLPSVYWWFVSKMRRPVEVGAPAGMRVALITLCVPSSESLEVIGEQLDALQTVDYPHDSWVLDEGDSADVRALAEASGVNYFSRKGIDRWNQPTPPFQRKTKAGNVNAWLDHIEGLGLEYEVFVQLDIDHRPRPDYLDLSARLLPRPEDRLGPGAQRGRQPRQLGSQGSRGAGPGSSRARCRWASTGRPGHLSSSARTRAIALRRLKKEIGGFQLTRAEDHLDTIVLAAHG